ncbi:MAG TPA: hypothetical protein VGO52_26675 [Hyphomonadaceae bacterium]|jgi:hypothetical protein|nr:hypothetical protein [Hyphomonadaceae bacterium]
MRLGALVSLLGLAMLAGGAQAQEPKPTYADVLEAVSHADCDKRDEARFMRFICRESGAVWYLTKEGEPAHPAYQVLPAWTRSNEIPNLQGMFRGGDDKPGETGDKVRIHMDAVRDWTREVLDAWRQTKPRVGE